MSLYDDYTARLEGEWTDIRFHLPYLYAAACRYPHVQVLEAGTRAGNSTAAFLAAAEQVDGFVFSVDIKDADLNGKQRQRWNESKRWKFAQMDDMAVEVEGGPRFDIVFIDTSHELYQTIAELRKFRSWVKPGGLILCHDTEWIDTGEQQYQHMKGARHGTGPVAWALDWFCLETGLRWENHPGSFGLGEIRL